MKQTRLNIGQNNRSWKMNNTPMKMNLKKDSSNVGSLNMSKLGQQRNERQPMFGQKQTKQQPMFGHRSERHLNFRQQQNKFGPQQFGQKRDEQQPRFGQRTENKGLGKMNIPKMKAPKMNIPKMSGSKINIPNYFGMKKPVSKKHESWKA